MKKTRFFEKVKCQKGLTGIDIITSVSIILITIAVVSMIYLNTTVESRNITRTAGATRIGTNILENIEKLSYEEFLENYENLMSNCTLIKDEKSEYNEYYLLNKNSDNQVFSTKIPNGYQLYMRCTSNYGTRTEMSEKFDLVRNVEIIIAFNVGDRTEKIDFQIVKTREIIEETNAPDTDDLLTSGIVQSEMNYYAVKYLDSSEVYIKINENDSSWYNYSNKQWATVIVSKQKEDKLFDINGKFIGTINTKKSEETYTERFVWIPRFFKKTTDSVENFYAFAYLSTGDNKIVSTVLDSQKGDNSSTLNLNTYTQITTDELSNGVSTDTTNFNQKAGKWVSCEIDEKSGKIGIINDFEANLLNASKYGPYTTSM